MKRSESLRDDFIKEHRLKIGEEVKVIREKREYSQDELAAIIEVNRPTISKMENLVLV